jgi:hypothetical protein
MVALIVSGNVYGQKSSDASPSSSGSGKAIGDVGPGISSERVSPPGPGGRTFGRPSWDMTPGRMESPRAPTRNPPTATKPAKKAEPLPKVVPGPDPAVPNPASNRARTPPSDQKPVQVVPGPDPAVFGPDSPRAPVRNPPAQNKKGSGLPPADQKPVQVVPGPDPAVFMPDSPRAPVRNPPVQNKKAPGAGSTADNVRAPTRNPAPSFRKKGDAVIAAPVVSITDPYAPAAPDNVRAPTRNPPPSSRKQGDPAPDNVRAPTRNPPALGKKKG